MRYLINMQCGQNLSFLCLMLMSKHQILSLCIPVLKHTRRSKEHGHTTGQMSCLQIFFWLCLLIAELRAKGARSTMGKRNWEMHESHKFWLGYDVTSVRPSVRPPLHVSQCEMRHSNPLLQPAFLLAGSCMANCFLERQT